MFCSSQAKRGLIVYCNLNPAATEHNPYDLVVVDRSRADPRHYYTFTDNGVTHMLGGHAQVCIYDPLHCMLGGGAQDRSVGMPLTGTW